MDMRSLTMSWPPAQREHDTLELGERVARTLADQCEGRDCDACGAWIWAQHPDPCLGHLPGVKYACCGHGDYGYVWFTNGRRIPFRSQTGERGIPHEFPRREILELLWEASSSAE